MPMNALASFRKAGKQAAAHHDSSGHPCGKSTCRIAPVRLQARVWETAIVVSPAASDPSNVPDASGAGCRCPHAAAQAAADARCCTKDSSRLQASLEVRVASQALRDDVLQLLHICHLQGWPGVMSAWQQVPIDVLDPRAMNSKPQHCQGYAVSR